MEKKYWIMSGGLQTGPLTAEELLRRRDVTPDTPVWHEGLADWTTVGALAELSGALRAAGAAKPLPPQPRTYLGWAIAAMLCCCLPTGLVAIFYAAKVAPAYQQGDYAASERASERAGWWCVISFVAGLIWTPFYMLYSVLAAL